MTFRAYFSSLRIYLVTLLGPLLLGLLLTFIEIHNALFEKNSNL